MTPSPPTLRRRPVSWRDIPRLVRLEREIYPDDAWSAASWWGELATRPRREYLLVEDEHDVVGYAGLDHAGEVSDVMTIAVSPQSRGCGLGRRLLDELIRRSAAAGAQRMLLEVRADNDAARALYARAGFELLQTRRGYYPGGVDALVLGLDLGDPSRLGPQAALIAQGTAGRSGSGEEGAG